MTMMKYGRYCVNVALFSVALPLMTGSLNSTQRQNSENYGASEAASLPAAEGNDISSPKADTRLIVPSLKTILARMSHARIQNQAHCRPYSVTREYKMFGRDRNRARSQVIAKITFVPPNSRNYSIQRTEGSTLGEMIVRRVLKQEDTILKDGQSTDISQDNYSFRFVREEAVNGHRCYVLQMLPRRKDKNLLQGAIWVDTTTYLIHCVEGEPEKNPSWWVRDVHIVLNYTDTGQMWLPSSSEYTAKVRVLGPSMMTGHDLRYSYPQFAVSGDGLIEKPPPILQEMSVSFSPQSKEVH